MPPPHEQPSFRLDENGDSVPWEEGQEVCAPSHDEKLCFVKLNWAKIAPGFGQSSHRIWASVAQIRCLPPWSPDRDGRVASPMAPGARHPVGGRPRTRRAPARRGRHGAPPPSTGRLSRHGGVRRTLPRVWRRRTRDATRVRGHRGQRCRHGCPGARRRPPGRLPPPSRRPPPRHGRVPGAARLAPEPGRPPVVADAVDGRRGHLVVAEDGPPSAGPRVGGRHERLPLAGLRDDPGGRARRSQAAPPSRAGRARGRAARRRAPSRAAWPGGTPRGASPGASCGGRARTAPPACASCRLRRRPRAHVLAAAGEGGGRQPPRPRGSGRATDPRSWPSGVLARGRAHFPGVCASRAPARTLGLGVLGGVPGLPGRATRAPPVQWRARRGGTCGRRRRRAPREIPGRATRGLAPSRARRSQAAGPTPPPTRSPAATRLAGTSQDASSGARPPSKALLAASQAAPDPGVAAARPMAPGAWRARGPPRRRWPPRGRRACRGVWPAPRSPSAARRSPARGRGGLRWARPPAPGRGRDAATAVREHVDAAGADARHEAPVVPGGPGAAGVAARAGVAPLVRPRPRPPGGVEAHAREGHRRREVGGERPRRGLPGPVAGGGVGALAADAQPRVGPGRGRDGRNRDEEASREGSRRRSRRTPSRFPSGGRGTSARGGSGPSSARTAATRPPFRRASDRPRSRRRVPPRAAPRRRARGSRRAPRRGAPPSRTPSPRSAATSIAGRGRGHLGPGAPARDHGSEAAAGAPRGPRRPAGPGVAIAGRLPPRQPPLPHEPADRRAAPGAGPFPDEPVAGPPRRMAPPPRSREAVGEHLGDPSRERAGRGPRPLGCQRRRGRQAPRARVPSGGVADGCRARADLGRPGPVGARSSDTSSCARGHGRPSLPPPGGWSRVSVPPGGGVGHGRAPCAGAWPRQCEYRTEIDGRVARKPMRFLLSSY